MSRAVAIQRGGGDARSRDSAMGRGGETFTNRVPR